MSTASLIFVAVAAAAVVAWFVLRHERRPIDVAPTAAAVTHTPKPPVVVPAEVERQVRRLLRERRKIYAIKALIDATGMGLREAKEYVENLPPRPAGATTPAIPAHEIPDELQQRVLSYVREKRKIYAIKELRDHTSMGLREAKEYVERLPVQPIQNSNGAVAAIDDLDGDRVPDDLQQRLRQYVQDKRKIYAIKELRDHTGMGLREAKEYVERL